MRGIDAERVWRNIMALAAVTDPERPYTRRAFTARFLDGRRWLTERFEAAGLAVSMDVAGNLIGRLPGHDPAAKPIVVGSHIDTVPDGGRFDGILGVLAGLEVVECLRAAGETLRHPLEVIDFLAEEPSDYGASCIGSRGMIGTLDAASLARANPDGEPLHAAIARMGGDPTQLDRPLRQPGDIAASLELHIEQGRVLETAGLQVGDVMSIVGIERHSVTVEGRADHAGTTPMGLRRDALAGSAQVIARAESLARDLNRNGDYFVATVGRLAVTPNAANVVPGRVEMTVEIRSTREAALADFMAALTGFAEPVCAERGLTYSSHRISLLPPTQCAPVVREAVGAAAAELGLRLTALASGAGHDTIQMARLGPAGMVFIRSADGRSHAPEEWSSQDDVAAGVALVLAAVRRLDRALP